MRSARDEFDIKDVKIYIFYSQSVARTLGSARCRNAKPELQHINLEYGKVLYEAGWAIEFVYFPLTGVISMMKTDGRQRRPPKGPPLAMKEWSARRC